MIITPEKSVPGCFVQCECMHTPHRQPEAVKRITVQAFWQSNSRDQAQLSRALAGKDKSYCLGLIPAAGLTVLDVLSFLKTPRVVDK